MDMFTLAYRRRNANHFKRVSDYRNPDRSTVCMLGHRLSTMVRGLQVYVVPTADTESNLVKPEEIGMIVMPSGKHISMRETGILPEIIFDPVDTSFIYTRFRTDGKPFQARSVILGGVHVGFTTVVNGTGIFGYVRDVKNPKNLDSEIGAAGHVPMPYCLRHGTEQDMARRVADNFLATTDIKL